VLKYKTNINKKSCTDVALTNPHSKKRSSTKNERRKINTKRGRKKETENPPKTIYHKCNFRFKHLTKKIAFLVKSGITERE
jgi:hypothetical protein